MNMSPRMRWILSIAVALAIYATIDATIRDTAPWQSTGAGGSENLDAVVTGIFSDHVLAFEVLGVLLTAAMIGAMIIARPLGRPLDSDNYETVDDDVLDETGRVSSLTAAHYTTAPIAAGALAEEEE